MPQPIDRHKFSGLAYALLSALAFGGSGPFARPLIDAGIAPIQVTWLRLLGMAILMLPFAVRHRASLRSHWRLLLGYGAFAIAGVQALYFAAIALIPVGIALLIEFLGPVLVVLWIAGVRRRPVSASATIGIGLAVLGLAGLLEVWEGMVLDPIGLLFAAAAAGCQAAFFLLSDAARDDVEPLALIGGGGCIAFAIMSVIARPWTLPWGTLGGEILIAGHTAPAMVSVLWLGLISTALAYLTGVAAVRRLSPPVAGGVAYLEVVVAIVLAWLLLAEALSAVQLTGAAVVALGAYITQRATPEAGEQPEAIAAPSSEKRYG